MELALVEDDVLLSRLEDVGRDFLALLDHLGAGAIDRDSAHRQRAGTIGAVAEARPLVGVAVADVDLFDRDAKRVGGDLSVSRVVALAVVVSADIDAYSAGRVDQNI